MKKKLKLDDLKVNSFITDENGGSLETIKGGGLTTIPRRISVIIPCLPQTYMSCPSLITCPTGCGCSF